MPAEGGETTVREHADVALLPPGDLGDLPVGKTFAPQVDRLPLRRGEIGEERGEPAGEVGPFDRNGGIGLPSPVTGSLRSARMRARTSGSRMRRTRSASGKLEIAL